ncbi:MAG TPA: hypothetical protein VL651_11950, partial [Bacteroidia bacterium]|nr:hypothetical protein [Bacteroidia bacterium]
MKRFHLHTGVFLLLLLFCVDGKIVAQHFANPDSLNGWYMPYDSNTYNVNKHTPSIMHFMKDGKYEAFGVAAKGKHWMYKGNWEKRNDSIFLYYDWSYDETIRPRYITEIVESVPFRDTLILSKNKYHYADPGAGIPPFALIECDLKAKENIPVTEAVNKILKNYSHEIFHPEPFDRNDLKGKYSWQGDAGQTTMHLKGNGKYLLRKGDGYFTEWEKGKWEMKGDTLTLKIRYSRLFFITDENPLRVRKFVV